MQLPSSPATSYTSKRPSSFFRRFGLRSGMGERRYRLIGFLGHQGALSTWVYALRAFLMVNGE